MDERAKVETKLPVAVDPLRKRMVSINCNDVQLDE
jgi:hypothetical protein